MNTLLINFVVALYVTAFTTFILGLFVYFYNRKNNLNKIFALYSISIAWWSFCQIGLISSPDKSVALTWGRVEQIGVFFIPTFFVHSVNLLLQKPFRKAILISTYTLSCLFALASLTPYMIADVSPKFFVRHFAIPGPLYPFAVLFFTLSVAYGLYELYNTYSRSIGIKRNQMSYLFWSSCLGYIGGGANFLLVFDMNIPFLNPYGTYAVALYVAATTYAIVRHRLMDISVVIHKGLVYSLLLSTIVVPTYLAVVISQRATPYSIPPLLTATLILACGLWIILQNPKAVPNITFSLVCLGVSIWLFGSFMGYSTTDDQEALFWEKLIYIGVVYIPALFYHFSVSFLHHRAKERLIIGNYLIGTLFLLLIPTDYLVHGLYSYFWGYYAKAGVLHPLLLVYFACVSGLSLGKLYRSYKAKEKADPPEAIRIKYVFWSSVIGYAGSIDFVQNYGFEFYPTGYIFVTLWSITVTYAILKYRLLDISPIITKAKAMQYAQVLALIPLYVVILMLIRIFTGSAQYLLAGILVAMFSIAAGLIVNLQTRIEKVVEKALFRKRYDAYETLTEFSKAMTAILDLKALNEKIILTLGKVMGIKNISLFLLDDKKESYFLAISHGIHEERIRRMKIKVNDPLPRYIQEMDQLLLREELEQITMDSSVYDQKAIMNTLSLIESELCIPLMNKDRLIGFLSLGHKAYLEMYSQEDLNLLSTMAQNAAIALDNALLYEDLKRQKSLMRRTDRLRSLETIAGGFAHEIRNPLTSIKTFIQLAPERKDDPEFIGSFSKVVSEDVHRIERLIQEILHYARYAEPKFTEENLNEVVESSLYFVGVKAESRAITIEKDLVGDLPTIWIDRQQIKQVLMNLFLNALDAMPNGERLFVKTHKLAKEHGERWVQIEIRDTGCGIPDEDLEHIFDPFFTTKHESEEREGTGLGLTIVHQIVQEHRGYIEVESKPGVGTTFYLNLPANPVIHDRRR